MTTTRPADPAAFGPRADTFVAEQRALEAAGALARAGTTLRHRLDEVQGAEHDPAWSTYAAAADAAVAHLQTDLILAGARLRSQRAADPDEVRDAVDAANQLVRQRLEDLKVQVRLGEMDVTAAAEQALEHLEVLARGLRDHYRRHRYTSAQSFADLRRAAGDAIHGAHRGLMAVAAAASSGDFAFEEREPAP